MVQVISFFMIATPPPMPPFFSYLSCSVPIPEAVLFTPPLVRLWFFLHSLALSCRSVRFIPEADETNFFFLWPRMNTQTSAESFFLFLPSKAIGLFPSYCSFARFFTRLVLCLLSETSALCPNKILSATFLPLMIVKVPVCTTFLNDDTIALVIRGTVPQPSAQTLFSSSEELPSMFVLRIFLLARTFSPYLFPPRNPSPQIPYCPSDFFRNLWTSPNDRLAQKNRQ